ncbi:MAG: hypothetical protein HC838_13595 [Spirulinaceae cyanobacterium RM2_2_10]|nr:hypothetical protein [Spirulinaceae cyanobacterium SM2_1_0]NJO20858.1 hypothetical protein [Spirulinaceae cyanobacterium RM2_2_10]
MSRTTKSLLALMAVVLSGLLIGILWVLGSPASSSGFPIQPQVTGVVQAERVADSDRLQAVIDCLPAELAIKSDQTRRERLDQALAEMGNDQLERVLALTDTPQLSEAETKLRACLQAHGVL